MFMEPHWEKSPDTQSNLVPSHAASSPWTTALQTQALWVHGGISQLNRSFIRSELYLLDILICLAYQWALDNYSLADKRAC